MDDNIIERGRFTQDISEAGSLAMSQIDYRTNLSAPETEMARWWFRSGSGVESITGDEVVGLLHFGLKRSKSDILNLM